MDQHAVDQPDTSGPDKSTTRAALLIAVLLGWLVLGVLAVISMLLQIYLGLEIWPSGHGYSPLAVGVGAFFLLLGPHFLRDRRWQPPALLRDFDDRALLRLRWASLLFALAPLAILIDWTGAGGTMRFVGLSEAYEALEQPLNAILGLLAMSIALLPLILCEIAAEARRRADKAE